ncbi:hypothetical protein BGW38_007292 [Lunasporangiospora selenospora]|uniref:Protein YAE1 n=1 Tax=Lunasporangiospora selenospora TaxID=979761 RepID=A0A9P6FLL2_9FUNG|nr:hypothetical protein BGW38_007292 [Lunasporangiospora selenospora]
MAWTEATVIPRPLDEDVWGDDDDTCGDADTVSYDRAIAEREWARLHENFGNSGYREGIEEGKEGTLQKGFNQGWSEGVQQGYQLGELRGLISPLLGLVETTPAIFLSNTRTESDLQHWIERAKELVKELTELDISHIFDKAYFDDRPQQPPSDQSESSSTSISTKDKNSGCCGGNSCGSQELGKETSDNQQADSCCKSKSSDNKAGGGSRQEKATTIDPERVIEKYRARVLQLLNEVGPEFGSLLKLT